MEKEFIICRTCKNILRDAQYPYPFGRLYCHMCRKYQYWFFNSISRVITWARRNGGKLGK